MEDEDSLPNPRNGPIQGMDSVIATVSGYQGSYRFNLIKLISLTGASYVGGMSSSTTHLICWRFQGRKYELAKKFKTTVVNHRWVEDCLRRGERVPELTYLLKSGEELGPPRLHVPDSIKEKKSNSLCMSDESTRRKMDLQIESSDNDTWNISHLLERQQLKQSSRSLTSRKRNTIVSQVLDFGPSLNSNSSEKDSCFSESSSRRRRLVKSNDDGETMIFPSADSGRDCIETGTCDPLNRATTMVRTEWTSANWISDHEEVVGNSNEDIHEIEGWHQPVATYLCVKNSLAASCKAIIGEELNAQNLRTDTREVVQTDDSSKLPRSIELSCVICWTEFSSTRGILPCGHRFCYSCIWNWADHMTSSKKTSTCPLCKTSFTSITKVEDAAGLDQKIYSQTMPHDSTTDVYLISDQELLINGSQSSLEPVCSRCRNREPEDLLIPCHLCQTRCIHSYCLDPPLRPWTCIHCKDLQMLFLLPR